MKRILIQDQETKHFLTEQGAWTEDANEARPFPTTLNAIVYGLQQNLTGIQLLVRFEGAGTREFVVNMDEERKEVAREFAAQPRGER